MTAVTRVLQVAACGLLLVGTLAACGSKDKAVDPPAELTEFKEVLDIKRVWSVGVGGGDEVLRLALFPVVEGERVYAAGRDGEVVALGVTNGKAAWKTDTKLELAAGPGVGAGLVVVGTADGDVVALEADTGKQRWRAKVPGEVLAAPAIGEAGVYVRTVDGRVFSLATADGKKQWEDEQGVPRLSLRGTAPVVLAGESLLAPYDNGKLVAYAPAQGDVLWEAQANPPTGRTELERMNDIDGAVAVDGRDVFVAGFQGRLAMVAIDSGQVWWSRDFSSTGGVALAGENLYATSSAGTVTALRRRDGAPVWEQAVLARRQVTPPAVSGTAVVVADFEGYVHWLDAETGTLLGRGEAGSRVRHAPVIAGDLVLLQNDEGTLTALRARPRGGR